jgi:hypothetical protein
LPIGAAHAGPAAPVDPGSVDVQLQVLSQLGEWAAPRADRNRDRRCGSLYLTGRPADLRAGRFDRLCSEFQQG